MARLTVAIPTHSMAHGDYFLPRCLDSLWNQSFQDFEIVITDNSDDDVVKDICNFYGNIHYYKNPRKGMAQNTNEAIKRSTGSLIKILYMDDYMAHDKALRKIVSAFELNDFEDHWLVTSCTHTEMGQNFTHSIHHPFYSENIQTGNNTIGSPSVLTIRNDRPLLFDEEMTWLLDAMYYKQMYERYGEPIILKDINVVIGLHPGQMTNILSDEYKIKELDYMKKKYNA